MRLRLLLSVVAATALAASADSLSVTLDDVRVTARRPPAMTGLTVAPLDTAALHRTIALSMADALAFNPSVMVKSAGRGTLSTVSMRGASPSHTLVEWNGLEVNSPLLGTTDFSMIPSSVVDRATLYYGGSSLSVGAGGLGGAVVMTNTLDDVAPGLSSRATVGAGSYATYDADVSLTWSSDRVRVGAGAWYSRSRNDFSYLNRDKMVNIYDEAHNIIGRYHPRERNVNGAWRDLHLTARVEADLPGRSRLRATLWWADIDRQIPLTTVDYSQGRRYINCQRDNTIRAVVNWIKVAGYVGIEARAGMTRGRTAYDYQLDPGTGTMNPLTTSRTHLTTMMADVTARYTPHTRWSSEARVRVQWDGVDSRDYASLSRVTGYERRRLRGDALASVRWQPTASTGVAATLRTDIDGDYRPVMALLSADWHHRALTLRASLSRNVKIPTLNDRYALPGGNPELRPERSLSADGGVVLTVGAVTAGLNGYYSSIDDWIMWLPTTKGFFSPFNVRRVASYGLEATVSTSVRVGRVGLDFAGGWSWTPATSRTAISDADRSHGHQLPYMPRYTATATATARWRAWTLTWQAGYYSRRYTMTASTPGDYNGTLPHYLLNNAVAGYRCRLGGVGLDFKVVLNNIFDVDYMAVLTRPMPGVNVEAFVGIEF